MHTFAGFPTPLARSLTWDQGGEVGRHDKLTRAMNIPVFFCDTASPWQCGSREDTSGLLRQYVPKGTVLSVHTATDLAAVGAELNNRLRKTLGWQIPGHHFSRVVATVE